MPRKSTLYPGKRTWYPPRPTEPIHNPRLKVRSVQKLVTDGSSRYGETYDPLREEVPKAQQSREQPALSALRGWQIKEMNDLAKGYMGILPSSRIPIDFVKNVIDYARKSGFIGGPRLNFAITDPDTSCFSLVGIGRRPVTEGLRIYVGHVDSPALRLSSKPLSNEWDCELKGMHLGPFLATFAAGGIHKHQYSGQTATVAGYYHKIGRNGHKPGELTYVEFKGKIHEHAIHVDPRDAERTDFGDAHRLTDLVVSIGDESIDKFLKRVGMERDEFACGRFFVLPPAPVQERETYIDGPGHDAKSGIYAALRAIQRAPLEYTTILIGFDKEEVNSGGTTGARGKFLEDTILAAIRNDPRFGDRDLTKEIERQIRTRTYIINTDVDVGSTGIEERNQSVLKTAVGRLGYGVGILSQDGEWDSDQISTRLVANMFRHARREGIVVQNMTNPMDPDRGEVPTFGEFFTDRGIETLCLPIPVADLHSLAETISKADLYYAYEMYRTLMLRDGPFNNEPLVLRK